MTYWGLSSNQTKFGPSTALERVQSWLILHHIVWMFWEVYLTSGKQRPELLNEMDRIFVDGAVATPSYWIDLSHLNSCPPS